MLRFNIIASWASAINESVIDDYINKHDKYLHDIDDKDEIVFNVDIPPLILQ